MFNNNENDEISFSEAYKSEILGNNQKKSEKNSLTKIIIILLLVAIIVGLGIFGYLYFMKESSQVVQPPKTSQMLDNIEELEKEVQLKEEVQKSPTAEKNTTETVTKESVDVEKNEVANKTPKNEAAQKGEETYLEQLAELSKEIDGEK